jgi:hypothetical protein
MNQQDYASLRLAAKRDSFKKHLTAYLIVIGICWITWLIFRSGVFTFYEGTYRLPWPIVSMVVWGLFVALHAIRAKI